VLLFTFVALISVAVNLETLVRLDLLGLSAKKLALFFSWVLFFFMVVTTVRPSEVRNFGKLIVGLATLSAVGVLVEYRFEYNAFWTWARDLIPLFQISDEVRYVSIDSMGRRVITGPTSHPLAIVTLLSLAVPFALSELLDSRERRQKVLYSVALVILIAGTFATARKTTAFVPVGTLLVFIAYRPRQMLRLSPLLLILIPAIHVLAPEAMGSVRNQLFPERGFLNQNSVSDRTADYEAVNPDIRSHMAFGKGFGAYDHEVFRLLDNQYLGLLVETGFVGLAAYLLLILAVPWISHRVIRFGAPSRAPPALAASAAAVAFGIANALFDALAFMHAPYAFIFISGLAAVLASEPLPARAASRVRPARSAPQLAPARPE
jgi:O-antigen ligase